MNALSTYGDTPLVRLVSEGYTPDAEVRLAQQLLKVEANVDARDRFGSTAMLVATERQRSDLVDPNIANCLGKSAALFRHR